MTLPDSGNCNITKAELIVLLNEAADKGATNALNRIGLHDESASKDIGEIRDLLTAWRTTKKTFWQTTVRAATLAVLGFIGAAVWVSFKTKVGQ